MSYALFLNPNITVEQAMALHKQQADSVAELMAKFQKQLTDIPDPARHAQWHAMVSPIIMQQLALSL